jgi:DNA polymerase-1
MSKIVIIDAHNFIHRANSSFNEEAVFASDGINYGTVYRFFRNLRPVIEQFKPNKVYLVLEGHPKFRYDIYPEYKSERRAKLSDDTKKQSNNEFTENKKRILELIKSLPIHVVTTRDFECDDVAAAIAKKHATDEVTILTNDNDYLQLLQLENPINVKIFSLQKKSYLEAPSYDILKYKALAGDSSDSIKGLPGVGDKTAIKCLTDQSLLTKQLAKPGNKEIYERNLSIVKFADVTDDQFSINFGKYDFDHVKSEFQRMELHSMLTDTYWDKFVKIFSTLSE